jgi:hypothetical protein
MNAGYGYRHKCLTGRLGIGLKLEGPLLLLADFLPLSRSLTIRTLAGAHALFEGRAAEVTAFRAWQTLRWIIQAADGIFAARELERLHSSSSGDVARCRRLSPLARNHQKVSRILPRGRRCLPTGQSPHKHSRRRAATPGPTTYLPPTMPPWTPPPPPLREPASGRAGIAVFATCELGAAAGLLALCAIVAWHERLRGNAVLLNFVAVFALTAIGASCMAWTGYAQAETVPRGLCLVTAGFASSLAAAKASAAFSLTCKVRSCRRIQNCKRSWLMSTTGLVATDACTPSPLPLHSFCEFVTLCA